MKVSLAAERDPVPVGIGDGGGAGIVKRDFVRERAISFNNDGGRRRNWEFISSDYLGFFLINIYIKKNRKFVLKGPIGSFMA